MGATLQVGLAVTLGATLITQDAVQNATQQLDTSVAGIRTAVVAGFGSAMGFVTQSVTTVQQAVEDLESEIIDMDEAVVSRTRKVWDSVTAGVDAIHDAAGKIGDSWGKLTDGFGKLSFIGSSVTDAADLQSQLNDIRINGDLTAQQMEDLGLTLRDLSMPDETNQSVEDLGNAVQELIDGGLSSDQAQVAVRSVGRAATATGDDIRDLAKTSAVLVDTLGIAPEGLSTALDQMVTIAGAGSVTLQEMGQYLPMLGAEAKTMGLQGTEAMLSMGAALEVVKKDSLSSADAAKGMQSFMTQVNSSKVQEKFKKLGIDLPKVMAEAAAKGENPMEAVLAKIDGALGSDPGKRKAALGDLFGNKQSEAFVQSMLARLPEYKQLKAEALASVGTVDEKYNKRMEEANQQMKAVSQAADGLSSAVGGALLSSFAMVMKPIVPVLKFLSDLALSSPVTTTAIVGLVGGLTLLPPVLSLVSTAWRILAKAFMSNPIGMVLGILAIAAGLIIENWEPISKFFADLWTDITKIWDNGIADILDMWDSVMGVVDDMADAVGWGNAEDREKRKAERKERAQAAKDRLAEQQAKTEAEQQAITAQATAQAAPPPAPVSPAQSNPLPQPVFQPVTASAVNAMETTAMPNGGAGLRAMAGNGVQAAQALAQAARIDVLVRFLNPPSGTTMQTSSSDNNIRVSAAVGYAMGD
jgi:TP901 family phage tail tape measure protein